jgi:hypothetical protein
MYTCMAMKTSQRTTYSTTNHSLNWYTTTVDMAVGISLIMNFNFDRLDTQNKQLRRKTCIRDRIWGAE